MTVGDAEAGTCGGSKPVGTRTTGPCLDGTGPARITRPHSVTTLSTIVVQAGRSEVVVSVLKSGSEVHVQLVHVHPGLSEIGSNQEENQTLVHEQQQLLDKLKKHEKEVLSAVEKKRKKMRREEEEDEEVMKAMEASVAEGWTLLMFLLQRRYRVLVLVSEFYCRVQEFSVGISRVQDLQIRPDHLNEDRLTYESLRRDLLGKSMQLLSSVSVLLQKLRHLQKTEALQRRGGSSRSSRGAVLMLEQLMETLQDQRRKADQQVQVQIQQVEKNLHKEPETGKIQISSEII
ncbi:coiled-coil domain-containing protein 141-like [Sphaeramia orbicularis]|uniref:coiled-coil domain-containing protein 141-like n=1 Tax=Sphaeramia orbicularis TaxID=375764 RepID=UPI00117C3BCB|nr:coiled-coil domain-containing protein 141-like [Sphaeramia orbicularis]